jgi:hypothetical protein
MKNTDHLLDRLLRTARENPPPPPATIAPFGFATRVAAQWAGAHPVPTTLPVWEQLCRRVAGGMAVAALVITLTAWGSWVPVEPDHDFVLETQLVEMLSLP